MKNPRSARLAWACAAILTVAIAILSLFAIRREGSWEQAPITDSAAFHADALRIKHAFESRGVSGLADAWFYVNRTHAPLVPAASALVMLVVGESRAAAESVLLGFVFLFLLSTFRAVEILYGTKTAAATTLLVASFSAFLNLSRAYLFELPFAALVVAGCWALLRSERFAKKLPTAMVGVCGGLAALTRVGGSALLIGPVVVQSALALREKDRRDRMIRCGVAILVGIALAAPWYVVNAEPLRRYFASVTYGDAAHLFAGGASLSMANAVHYLEALTLEGPGLPMIVLALVAYCIGAIASRRATLFDPRMAALGVVFAIDFGVLMLAAQRCGSILFVSAFPIVALAIVRAVASVRPPLLRGLFALAVAALAVQQTIAVTLAFPLRSAPNLGVGPWPRSLPIWSHKSFFIEWAGPVVATDGRYGTEETVALLEGLGLAPATRVVVLSDHPFLNANTIAYRAVSRRRSWNVASPPPLPAPGAAVEAWLTAARDWIRFTEAVVVRTPDDPKDHAALYGEILVPYLAGKVYCRAGEPIVLSDGSKVRVYVRVPRSAGPVSSSRADR